MHRKMVVARNFMHPLGIAFHMEGPHLKAAPQGVGPKDGVYSPQTIENVLPCP